MPRIDCLHTADSNIDVFDEALGAARLPDVELRHHVRADLLAAAEQTGRLTPEVTALAVKALKTLGRGADAVLLTCSTQGPAAELARQDSDVPTLRVDAALAAEAVRGGGRIAALCAISTTVEPTRLLFEAAARATGAEVTVHLVPDAWQAFKAGDRDRYFAIIAHASEEALRGGATRVALAQASMAEAARLAASSAVLTSPTAGLRAALAASCTR